MDYPQFDGVRAVQRPKSNNPKLWKMRALFSARLPQTATLLRPGTRGRDEGRRGPGGGGLLALPQRGGPALDEVLRRRREHLSRRENSSGM